MDDCFDFPLVVGSQGDHIAPVTLGNQVILKIGGHLGITEHALHAREQAIMLDTQIAADRA